MVDSQIIKDFSKIFKHLSQNFMIINQIFKIAYLQI